LNNKIMKMDIFEAKKVVKEREEVEETASRI
jgi:hypothetical protein